MPRCVDGCWFSRHGIQMTPVAPSHSPAPIGVFDSGLGGLTVVRALRRHLPEESIVYFGDTARLPYGTKSPRTVLLFARQCLQFLMQFQPKALVVACNTVSATAMAGLADAFPVPVIGVLEPGSQAAVLAARRQKTRGNCTIGLIATEATIASKAYPQAIARLDRGIHLVGRACPLLVPLIEEGRPDSSPVVTAVLADYLSPLRALNPQALILGCTHYPILDAAIAGFMGPDTELIDSADQTALVVKAHLATMAAAGAGAQPPTPYNIQPAQAAAVKSGSLTCYVTDQGQRFESLANRFLGAAIGSPVWVDPELLERPELEEKA